MSTPQELMPLLHIDCPDRARVISQENIQGLDVLEPFGMGNPQPIFSMRDMLVEEITPISSDRHVRLTLSKNGMLYTAMLFGTGQGGCGFAQGNYVDAAFNLEINEYRGRRSVQLVIKGYPAEHLRNAGRPEAFESVQPVYVRRGA